MGEAAADIVLCPGDAGLGERTPDGERGRGIAGLGKRAGPGHRGRGAFGSLARHPGEEPFQHGGITAG